MVALPVPSRRPPSPFLAPTFGGWVVAGFGRIYPPDGLASRLPSFPSSSTMDEQEEDGGEIRGKDENDDDDGGEAPSFFFSRGQAGGG